jgi:hypothetical protein
VEQQRRSRTIVVWSAIGVAVLVVGLLVYGLVVERWIKGRVPVARVNGVTITAHDLREEIDFLQRFYMMPISAEYIDFVLDDILIREELVRREVERRGLVVPAEDVQREIEEQQGYYRDGTPTPTPTLPATSTPVATAAMAVTGVLTPTPTLAPIPTSTPVTAEGFQQAYAEFLTTRGISDKEFRDYVRAQLMYEVLLEDFRKDVPVTLDQVHLRYLRVTTEEQAGELLRRLEDGSSFEALQGEIELDTENPGSGSDLAWYTEETLEQALGADVVERAFGVDSGLFIQESQGMYFVVEVVEHSVRDVGDTLADQLASKALSDWIEAQQASVEHLDYDHDYVLVDAPAGAQNPQTNP